MPLKAGSSRRVISENISEFHKGPTYAKTAAKFGKKRAQAQAVAVALSTARKYGRKYQEGGEVEELQTEEGFPFLQAKGPLPTGDVIPSPGQPLYQAGRAAVQRLMEPPPIKPETPPPQEPIAPPHETTAAVGKEFLHELNPLRWFEPPPLEELPPDAYKGKVAPTQTDWLAPVAAGVETGLNLVGIPSAIGAGISKAAIAFGAKMATQQATKQLPKLAGHDAALLALEHGFLNTTAFKKAGHQLGYMPGGVYTDPASGAAYYLKIGPTIDQVKNEQLASKIYNLAGVPTAEVSITHINGSPGIASKMLPDSHQLSQATIPYNQIKGLHENFVVDAWLANHDTVGTGDGNPFGNIMIQNGQAIRIDGGGALRYKGSGDLKKHFYDEADEINSMRDPNFSKRSAQVFGDISNEALRIGAQKVADIDEYELAKLIAKYGPSEPDEQAALFGKLLKRRQYIMDHFGVQPKSAAKPVETLHPVEQAPDDWWQQAEKDLQQIPFEDERMIKEKDFSQGPLPPEARPSFEEAFPQFFGEKDYIPPVNALGDIDEGVSRTAKPDPVELFKKTGAANKLGPKPLTALLELGALEKKTAKNLATVLHSGPDSPSKPFETASYLWQVADVLSPHKAEAIFRALPEDTQKMVGRRLMALKKEFGSSPFDKVSGETGKYLTTHTALHAVPDHLWTDPIFTKQLSKAVDSLGGKPVKAIEGSVAPKDAVALISSPNTSAQEAADHLVNFYGEDTSKIANAMYRLADKKPEFVDNLYKKLPEELQVGANADLQVLIDKHGDPWKKKAWVPKTAEDQDIFDAIKPVKDWQSYTPKEQNFESPKFSSLWQRKKAESTGHNVKMLLWKGHSKSYDYPEEIKDFSAKKDWKGNLGFERANFLSHVRDIAGQYGKKETPYVARGKVYEVDFKDLYGQSSYFEVEKGVHRIVEAARSKGADMVLINNITDYGPHGHHTKQTQYAVLNQEILRAPHAKFDPTKLHLARPLLGLVGGGLLVYGGTKDQGPRKFARGGPGSAPWNIRKGSHIQHNGGMIQSSIPGRTDKIPLSVKSGSYILPADIPSALGQGNTMAGGDILRNMLKKGPYSTKAMPFRSKKTTFPRLSKPKKLKFSDGGDTSDIPIIAAGGEFVIPPEDVAKVGGGNMDAGHRALDQFVLGIRKRHIETLKKLKPPKQ